MTSARSRRSTPIGTRKLESKEWESVAGLAYEVVVVEARGGGSFGSGLSSFKSISVERAKSMPMAERRISERIKYTGSA